MTPTWSGRTMGDETAGRRALCGGQAEYLWAAILGRRRTTEWRLRATRGQICLSLRGVSRSRQRADDAARWGVGLLDELAELLRQAAHEAGLGDSPPVVIVRSVDVPPALPAGACVDSTAEIDRDASPLICPTCQCAWPDLTADPDGELLRCDCGAEMRARRRREQS